MLLTPHGSVFLCENPFFQLHETQYWWEYKKSFQNIKNEISSECWENWIFCFIDLKVSESPIMLLLVPNWRAYLALWLVNSLSFISTTKVTLWNVNERELKREKVQMKPTIAITQWWWHCNVRPEVWSGHPLLQNNDKGWKSCNLSKYILITYLKN